MAALFCVKRRRDRHLQITNVKSIIRLYQSMCILANYLQTGYKFTNVYARFDSKDRVYERIRSPSLRKRDRWAWVRGRQKVQYVAKSV